MTEFDPLAHARAKAHRYEQEALGLRAERDKLVKMLALACTVATGGTDVDPLALCALIEELA